MGEIYACWKLASGSSNFSFILRLSRTVSTWLDALLGSQRLADIAALRSPRRFFRCWVEAGTPRSIMPLIACWHRALWRTRTQKHKEAATVTRGPQPELRISPGPTRALRLCRLQAPITTIQHTTRRLSALLPLIFSLIKI